MIIKADYRGETRKFKCISTSFPSYQQIKDNISRVFPLALSYHLTNISLTTWAAAVPAFVANQVSNEEEWNNATLAFRASSSFGSALLRFSVVDNVDLSNPFMDAFGRVPPVHPLFGGPDNSNAFGPAHSFPPLPDHYRTDYASHFEDIFHHPHPVPETRHRFTAEPHVHRGRRRHMHHHHAHMRHPEQEEHSHHHHNGHRHRFGRMRRGSGASSGRSRSRTPTTQEPANAQSGGPSFRVPDSPPDSPVLPTLIDIESAPAGWETAAATAPSVMDVDGPTAVAGASASDCCSVASSKREIKGMVDSFLRDFTRVVGDTFGDETMEAPSTIAPTMTTSASLSSPPHTRPNAPYATPVHPNCWCDACGSGIRGVRYKCETCPNYDLCQKCFDTVLHPTAIERHSFREIRDPAQASIPAGPNEPLRVSGAFARSRPGQIPRVVRPTPGASATPTAPTVIPSGARSGEIVGRDRPMSFMAMNPATSPVVHNGIICDKCDEEIVGERNKCVDCADYDLCSLCIEKSEDFHPGHRFFTITEPSRVIVHTIDERGTTRRRAPAAPTPAPAAMPTTPQPTIPEEHNARCDLCDSTIVGIRFKCAVCPDWDTCINCFAIVPEQHPGHTFIRIHKQEDLVYPLPTPVRNIVRHRATCNACKKTCYDVRYKCMHPMCDDFDLCDTCEALPIPVHPAHHPLLKLRDPAAAIPKLAVAKPLPVPGSTQAQRAKVSVPVTVGKPAPKVKVNLPAIPKATPPVPMVPPAPAPMVMPMVAQPAVAVASPVAFMPYAVPGTPPMVFAEAPKAAVPIAEEVSAIGPAPSIHDIWSRKSTTPPPVLPPKPARFQRFDQTWNPGFSRDPEFRTEVPPAAPAENPFDDVHRTKEDDYYFTDEQGYEGILRGMHPRDFHKDTRSWSQVLADYDAAAARDSEFDDEFISQPILQPVKLQQAPEAANEKVSSDVEMVIKPEESAVLEEPPAPTMDEQATRSPPSNHGSTRSWLDMLESSAANMSLGDLVARAAERAFPTVPSTDPTVGAAAEPAREALPRLLSSAMEMVEKLTTPPASIPEQPRSLFMTSPFLRPTIEPQLIATFVSDNTIPDGHIFPPGAEFSKSWHMANEGELVWPENTELVFIAGFRLGAGPDAQTKYHVGAVQPGERVDVVAVDMKAPETPGHYIGYWRLSDGTGNYFGHRVWCDIVVAEPEHDSGSSLASSSVIMPGSAPSVISQHVESVHPESVKAESVHEESVRAVTPPAPVVTTPRAASVESAPPTPRTLASDDDFEDDFDTDSTGSLIDLARSDESDDDAEWDEGRRRASPAAAQAARPDYVVLYDSASADEA